MPWLMLGATCPGPGKQEGKKGLVLLWPSPRKEPRSLLGLTGLHWMPSCKPGEWHLPAGPL